MDEKADYEFGDSSEHAWVNITEAGIEVDTCFDSGYASGVNFILTWEQIEAKRPHFD